ncbi:sodium:solute symporter family protein [Lignipirellula cremea]|uniref:Sodium/proline symporter n=1 Tax=Lignipirellula cremea TaxID=2528010 RepID=A0A518DZK4_9BACT|nr:sodium:solute symporter family protein [Lignipirellula cremea]QDU97267.1 Sodium/proline symporter [Lignipirellula cremea]
MPEISAGMQGLLGGVIAVYLVGMYALGYYAQQKIETHEDFLVAGRKLPLSLAWMTLLATWFGAGTLLTATDTVREEGLAGAALDPLGCGVCLLLAGVLVAGPIWRMKLLTVADLFRRRFGPWSELLSSIVLVPSYFGWVAAQFVALAGMLQLFFGLDPFYGLTCVAIVGVGYTLMGGMWSVTLTDAVQISLVLVGVVVLGGVVLVELGGGDAAAGWMRLVQETPAEKQTLIPHATAIQFWQWLGVFAVGALGNLPGQDLMQRIFAARSARVAQGACYLAGGLYLLFGAVPVMLGLAAPLLFPELQEAILPTLAHAFLSPVVTVIFVVALMSAVLSTIDSAILSPASVLAQNVFPRFTSLSPLKLNRFAVLLVTAGSLAAAYSGESAYELLEAAYEVIMVSLLVPLLLGLYTRPRSEWPAVASILSGFLVWAIHFGLEWDHFAAGWPLLGAYQAPTSLCATGVSLLAYLLCEPPWTMRRATEDSDANKPDDTPESEPTVPPPAS